MYHLDMIYVVLQEVLKNDLYIRLTHNFHYRNPLLLVCPGGLFPVREREREIFGSEND